MTAADLEALYREAGLTAFVGVRAGDHLIYIAEAGSDLMSGFEAQPNLRRGLLTTAGGKALLAALPETELHAFLRRRAPEEKADVDAFLEALPSIRESRIAINVNPNPVPDRPGHGDLRRARPRGRRRHARRLDDAGAAPAGEPERAAAAAPREAAANGPPQPPESPSEARGSLPWSLPTEAPFGSGVGERGDATLAG